MNLSNSLKEKLFELVSALSLGDFYKISANKWLGRTTAPDLKRVILEYGKTLTLPPENFLEVADIFELDDECAILIDIPLWTQEEGRSDLVISVQVALPKEDVSINDLRVP